MHYLVLEPELRQLDNFVPRGKVAVDVGTWWGPWSYWLSRHVPQVEAFEPNSSIYSELREVLPANVSLHNVALSDQVGEGALWSPGPLLGTEGRSTLVAEGHPGWVQQEVKTSTLDEFGLSDVGFVKIDVEGLEFSVLRGGVRLLTDQRPNVMVEVEQAHSGEEHMDRVFGFMKDLGFEGSYLDGKKWHRIEELDRQRTLALGERQKSMGMFKTAVTRESYVHNFLFRPIA
jgi:FkbM family methyltransferase